LPEENIHRPYIHRHTPQNRGLEGVKKTVFGVSAFARQSFDWKAARTKCKSSGEQGRCSTLQDRCWRFIANKR
jgi:hypothetical protein